MKEVILPERLARLHVKTFDLFFRFRRMKFDYGNTSKCLLVEQAFEKLLTAIESCGAEHAPPQAQK